MGFDFVRLDDVVHFDVVTHNPSTGAVQDADSPPVFRIYEEDVDAIITEGTMTKRAGPEGTTGHYRGSFTTSGVTGIGFEVGRWYSIVVVATVSSVTSKKIQSSFIVSAYAFDDLGTVTIPVDIAQIGGDVTAAENLKASNLALLTGSVNDGTPAAGSFDGNTELSATDSFYVNSVLSFQSGVLQGIAKKVTSYTGSSRTFGFTEAFPAAPANGDTFIIIGKID